MGGPTNDALAKDAARFQYLQNCPIVEAQSYFWHYESRKQRAKAIDEAIARKADRPVI